MISLGIAQPAAPEVRTSSGYTSLILAALERAASGGSDVPTACAAVEMASGAWGRALALAEVSPRSRRTEAITPSFLEMAGRELGRRGEAVWVIDVRSGGRVRLLPAAAPFVVVGGHLPETWRYHLSLYGPGTTATIYRMRAGVVHLKYGATPERPFEGRSPWMAANLSGKLLAGVERQLAGEASGPSGYVMAVPDVGDQGQAEEASDAEDAADPIAALRRDLAAAGGKTTIAPTQMAGYGAGPGAAPTHDYKSSRFGLNPPESAVETRENVQRSILGCYGLLPVTMHYSAPGTSLREAWRQFVSLSVEPLATLIGSQLSEALGVDVKLDMRKARAADVVMLSRAVGSLVQHASMTPDQAREVVGL